jgi:tetratricopeptide (TPR) repeat protein
MMSDPAPSLDERYAAGFAHHGAGRLDEAASAYREILALDPNHADTLHLLGVLIAQAGDPASSVPLVERAIAINPQVALYHANLAEIMTRLGRYEDAERLSRQALALSPGQFGSLVTLGHALEKLGRDQEAVNCYAEALRLKPDYAQAHTNLGAVLSRHGQLADAEPHFREVVRLEPQSWSAHANLCGLLLQQGRAAEAEPSGREAVRLNPRAVEAWLHMGTLAATLDRPEEAEAHLRTALELDPSNLDGLHNLAIVLEKRFRFEEAERLLDAGLEIAPDNAKLQRARAILAADIGQYDVAERLLRERIEAVPNDADAHLSLAFNLLLTGRFAEGWEEYDWRWRSADGAKQYRGLVGPQWQGEPLEGRTLLLHAEQGLGDTLHFARYLKLIEPGARTILEVPEQLFRLAHGFDGVDQVLRGGEAPPAFDMHCPLMSLPRIFQTRLETIPADIPYLSVDPAAVLRWRARFDFLGWVRVGLVWSGGPRMVRDRQRSIALERLRPLADILGIAFVSLQKGEAAGQIAALSPGFLVHDWTEELTDMADTASLVSALDLVIGVDTAAVHLAGALGKPVWLLNRFSPDWRWLLGRDDSPWYPTLRQFRQPAPGDWDGAIASVAAALVGFMPEKSGKTL